ncbi:hypothetical protein EJB05_48807 [Eragrostis curvula]|uniref:Replication factor-A protein 1 N-terminal domain-containing protein n=1 Tax=Eragrostis curvula TaxID=38414 RepID=A0A5J9T3R2_9POAL|nr:hypothetical protein EJB05_48807 [Eragrostis curvula]
MAGDERLTLGAVAAILEGSLPAGLWPWLQVTSLSISTRGEGNNYGMLLSDGDHFMHSTLAASLDDLVKDGRIRPGTVVRLEEFTVVTLPGSSRGIEVKHLGVVQANCERIGNPSLYRSSHLEVKHDKLNVPSAYRSSHLELKRDKLNVDSVASPVKLNCGAYSGGQGLNWHLTRGAVALQGPELQRPVMQVVGVSQMRLELNLCHFILSDGVHTLNAMLSPVLSHLVEGTRLRKGTIVRLLMFSYNTVRIHSMVVVGNLEVLQTECDLIGSPKAYELCCIKKPSGPKSNCGEPYSKSAANYAQPNNVSYSSCQDLKWYLTHGAVAAIMKGEMAVEQRPVMQVVDFSLTSQNGFSFYLILLSDGVHQVYANLFPHLSHLVVDNYLLKGSRVRLLKFIRETFNQDQNYRHVSHLIFSVITIAVELEVLNKECELIGSPTFYELGNKEQELDAVSLDDLLQLLGGSHPAGQSLKGHLTRGIVAMMQQPVMQVITVYLTIPLFKKHGMYSLMLSDGVHAYDAILLSKLNHLAKNNHIRSGTIVRLLEVVFYSVQSPSRILVNELEVLQIECELIGSPEAYDLCRIKKPHVLQCKCEEPYPRSVASYAQPFDKPRLNGQSYKGHLTQGVVAAMFEGEITVQQQPLMQVVSFPSEDQIELSDGVHKAYGFLLPHLRHLVSDNRLRKGTIVHIPKFVFEERYFSIEELEVLQTEHKMIGRPTFYEPHLHGPSYKGHLTPGAVAAIFEGEIPVEQQPVMQVVDFPRFGCKIELSDGVHKAHGFLLPHLRHLVSDNRLLNGTIVRVLKIRADDWSFSIEELEVLQKGCKLIGRPTFYERDAAQPTGGGGSHPRYKATPG